MPGHVRARKDANGRTKKRADGSTIWQARWRKPDDPAHRREANFKTKRSALAWLTAQESGANRGVYTDPRKGETRFPALADELRGTWGDLEPKTREGYEAILTGWLVGERDPLAPSRPCRFRSARVASITPETVQVFVNEVAAARAPNTVRRIYSILSAVLRLAVQRGYLAVSPCDAVKLPSKKRAGVRRSHLYLEGPELRALAQAVPEPYRLAVYVAGSCGLRAGELWALRRRDVDLLHRELTIRYALKEISSSAASLADDKGLIVGPPKSAASRRRLSIASGLVPLLETALAEPGIAARGRGYAVTREDSTDRDRADLGWSADPSDPDRLLFVTARGYPIRHNQFYKRIFAPVVAAALPARLAGFRWHDLRHTCAALSLAEGGSLHHVKERLGHENIATTVDLYGKRVPSVDAALADAVGASIFEPGADNVIQLARGE